MVQHVCPYGVEVDGMGTRVARAFLADRQLKCPDRLQPGNPLLLQRACSDLKRISTTQT